MTAITQFIKTHFRHFNAAVVVDAAEAWNQHLDRGGKMFLTMAGAMSTAEIGLSLAEMIRKGKVHGISCTAANLEEDLFNLVAHEHYRRVPHYRTLSTQDEVELLEHHFNRVTDTCIPEEEAMRHLEKALIPLWQEIDKSGKSLFPYEFAYEIIRRKVLEADYQIDPKNSWVVAACEKNLPILTPGWEDCTTANFFVARVRQGLVSRFSTVKSGAEQMSMFIDWYLENTKKNSMGFFQIGGGIAGDFPICTVPLIRQDLEIDAKLWGYFCQVSDSTTSYGSYSGAVPNEKITWEKLAADTPKFIIESDASIVAPLVFAYVLGW